MAEVYFKLIQADVKTIDQVPAVIRPAVQALIDKAAADLLAAAEGGA